MAQTAVSDPSPGPAAGGIGRLLTIRPPPRSTLFPYTTLFRSAITPQHASTWTQLSRGGLSCRFRTLPSVRRCADRRDRKSTRLNSSHSSISYAVFCLKKKRSADAPPAGLRRTRGREASRLHDG